MPTWLRRTLLAFALTALIAYAYDPLARCGFVGEDVPTLVDAGRIAWPKQRALAASGGSASPGGGARATPAFSVADLYEVHGTEDRPLAALSLALSSRVESDHGRWNRPRAIWPRLENLLLVMLAAFGLKAFVRRLFLPWTGPDPARAAGTTAGILLVLHPLTLSTVASVAARGDCIAMAIGCGSAALFLRGRQQRRPAFVLAAVVGAVLCGFSSALCMFLPPAFAIAEYVAARRSRPAHIRLRTAATTLVVFLAAISIEALLRSWLANAPTTPAWAQSMASLAHPARAQRAALYALEKLGVLLLPVNSHGIGEYGPLIAGALLLIALQPALVAARVAPRLWTWAAVGWAAAILVSAIPDALVRVHPQDWANARALFPGAAVMAVGLAFASTSLSGTRRFLIPAALAIGYAVLANSNARPWLRAEWAVRDLGRDIEEARALHGRELPILVVVMRPVIGGLDALRPALPALIDPAFAREGTPLVRPPEVRGVSLDAFRLYSRSPEFATLREQGLIVLFPRGELAQHAPGIEPALDSSEREDRAGSVVRASVRLDAPGPEEGARMWRTEGRSPVLDMDPFSLRSLRVQALPDAADSSPPVMEWRARSPLAELGRLEGIWAGAADPRTAWFDVERSLTWLLAERIRRVWFTGSLASIASAELLGAPPPAFPADPDIAPLREGIDWIFEPAVVERASLPEGALLVLDRLDLETLEFESTVLVPEPQAPGVTPRRWRARRAALPPGPLQVVPSATQRVFLWSLDVRIDGVTIGRTTGRYVSSTDRS